MNSERFEGIMAGLERHELSLSEKRFVGLVKEYFEDKKMISEEQESILEGINKEKIRWMNNPILS